MSEAEANKIIQTIKTPGKQKKNKKLRRELVKMREIQTELNEKILSNPEENKRFVEELNSLSSRHLLRLCGIFKEYGWLTEKIVEKEGLEAALFIVRNSSDGGLQGEIFPVIVEAAQKGFISKANLASLIDRIRLKSGGRQIFGTQIKIEDEVGYLYPLENESKTDDWRRLYGLPPLREFIKQIESEYRTIVVKMPPSPTLKNNKTLTVSGSSENLIPGLSDDETEILNVESRLVNLNVRVLDKNLNSVRSLDLRREDFVVLENGREQEISFFSTTDTAFDLVLLLDLSGSTLEKQKLIAASARRFIELARPSDRIAVIGFTDRARIISEFSSNKPELFAKVAAIDDYGSSRVWDALQFTFEKILAPNKKRRSAVVFMTDGVDNTLLQNPARPASGSFFNSMPSSKITFTELLETVRNGNANVFSIYLDTESSYSGRYADAKSYRQARRTLKMIAEESGGQFYRAGHIEDLSGIYENIINDLSEVYSLGYEPKNADNDGSWRELKIRIKGKPDLTVKTKRGYYAN